MAGQSFTKKPNLNGTVSTSFIFLLLLLFPFYGNAEEQIEKHSSELRQVVSIDGNVERIDFVDQDGNVTFAADKHYATLIKTKTDGAILEEYFDASGAPAKQTSWHYALLREYDDLGRNYKTTYLDMDGSPMINKANYCSFTRSFYDDGNIRYEHYYDVEGKPTKRSDGVYGRYNEYENGRNTVVVLLDENDQPLRNTSGYAILKRTYYEEGENKGKVDREFYFDENGNPIAASIGQFGLHNEYDSLGRTYLLTYLDADGQPMKTNRGYATVKRTFNTDNSIDTEMFYDPHGQPVALSRGQYGLKHVNGIKVYLDINGKEMFDLNNYLHTHPMSVILIALIVTIVSALCGKKISAVLLPAYLLFIVYMTLMYRADGDTRAQWEVFWSYKQFFSSPSLRLEILNNVWLFLPLGAMLYKLWPHISVMIIPVFISVLIEAIQYFTGCGLCEFDDVISNSLGALVGFSFAYVLSKLKTAVRKR